MHCILLTNPDVPLKCLIDGGVVVISPNPNEQGEEGGLKNYQHCYRKSNGFLPQLYIKVALPCSQKETTLNQTQHAITVLFL